MVKLCVQCADNAGVVCDSEFRFIGVTDISSDLEGWLFYCDECGPTIVNDDRRCIGDICKIDHSYISNDQLSDSAKHEIHRVKRYAENNVVVSKVPNTYHKKYLSNIKSYTKHIAKIADLAYVSFVIERVDDCMFCHFQFFSEEKISDSIKHKIVNAFLGDDDWHAINPLH